MNKGIWYAIGAYATWGLFPIYWKWLHAVPALQLVGHRIGWSFLLLCAVILLSKQWRAFRAAALTWRVLLIYLVAALLIGVNWLTYIWAVIAGLIVETSLGYFINPLLSVLMGVIFLRERLRPMQWLPIGLAAAGVLYLTFAYGALPWIALTLAFSFGLYGLIKKVAPLGSLYGLTLETGILFLPALVYLVYAEAAGTAAFLHTGAGSDLLLIGAGTVTTIPLLLFASAARRIPLSLVGILQYIAPTLQFLLGVLVYHEPFDQAHFIGFGIVWAALIFFGVEGFLAHRAQPVAAVAD
ncbi:MAG: EamA family transporter RarD [Anaerolineales bacterium]|nr:EamA family transporter RarD [Anaerolineales bacterium]